MKKNDSTLRAMLEIFEEKKGIYSLFQLLMGILRIQSISRYVISSSDTKEFSTALSLVILDKCPIEDLQHVPGSLLSPSVIASIIEYRKCCSNQESYKNIEQLKLQLADAMTDFLVIAQEVGQIRTVNEEIGPGDFTDMFSGLQNECISDSLGLIPRLVSEICFQDTGSIPASLRVSGGVLSRIDNSNQLLNLAKAGLGMIWSSVKAQEVDHTPLSKGIVVVLVLGGISFYEIQQILQMREGQELGEKKRKVIVIGTRIIGPNALFDKLVNFRRTKSSPPTKKLEI